MNAEALIRQTLGLPEVGPDATRKVFFESFGCQMNLVDSELVLAGLHKKGYTVCARREDADVILFNTCSVRQHAEDKVWSRLGQLASLKKRKPDVAIGVIGCMAQNEGENIRRRAPHVDLVAGTRHFSDVPTLVEEVRARREPVVALDIDRRMPEEREVATRPEPFKAFVSVMRGCDMACTYCVVPKTRGKEISKPVREIHDEVVRLVADGVTEVTLLGQTVNSYGKHLDGRPRFSALLEVLNEVQGLKRLRFITSYPMFMTRDLWRVMGECEKVMPYLHLPVQAGSNSVLRSMNRLYTRERYLRLVEQGRELCPELELATDWILGFPGESDADFEESLALLEEVEFQGSFVFRYSPRSGTPAADLVDDVPEPVKKERQQRMLAAQNAISLRKYGASVGSRVEVLVEGVSKRNEQMMTGRDPWFRLVHFPVTPGVDSGDYVSVRITSATGLSLTGALDA